MYDGERWHHWWGENKSIGYRGVVSHEKGAWGVLSTSRGGKLARYNSKNNRWEMPWRLADKQEFETFAMALNSQGSLFALSDGKIAVYNEPEWSYIDSPCPRMNTLSIDHSDHSWTWDEEEHIICQYDGNGWYLYNLPLEAPQSFGSEHVIHFDSQGNLWTAVENSLILRTTSEQWYLYDKSQLPLEGEEIGVIAIDPQDRVWLLNRNHIAVTDGEQWHLFSLADLQLEIAPTLWFDTDIMQFDKRGHLWLPLGGGKIARFSGEVPLGRFNQDSFIEQAKPLTVSVESRP